MRRGPGLLRRRVAGPLRAGAAAALWWSCCCWRLACDWFRWWRRPSCPPTCSATCGTGGCRRRASTPTFTCRPRRSWSSCGTRRSTPAPTGRRRRRPSIPPMAQVIFAAIGQTWSSLQMVKIVMAGFEAITIAALVLLLRRAALPAAGVLVYAWNPLPLWEYAGNGHIDAASIAFMALAMLAASGRRRRWAGAVLGLAILCKLLPAAVFPAFWRRWDWRTLAGTVGGDRRSVCRLYRRGRMACARLPAGLRRRRRAGFRQRLLRVAGAGPVWPAAGVGEQGVSGGRRPCLLLGLAGYFMLKRPLPIEPGPRILAIGRRPVRCFPTATTIVLSPHYPWYVGWLSAVRLLRLVPLRPLPVGERRFAVSRPISP